MNKQYFYLVVYSTNERSLNADKIFLQEKDAVRHGRRLATKNPEFSVKLYRQLIARTAPMEFIGKLFPFKEEK